MKFLLVSLVLALTVLQVFSQLDCNNLNSVPPRKLKRCYDTFLYQQKFGQDIVESFKKTIQFSTLTPVFNANLPPYNLQVDLIQKLDEVGNQQWNSFFDFFVALKVALESTKDAHVSFGLPDGFRRVNILRPYSISLAQENGEMVVRLLDCLNPCPMCSAETQARVNEICTVIQPKIGARIIQINNMDAYEYLLKLAEPNAKHPDLGGRLNYVLQTFNTIQLHEFFGYKLDGTETLTFGDGESIKIDIIANKAVPTIDIMSNILPTIKGFHKKMEASFKKMFSPNVTKKPQSQARNILIPPNGPKRDPRILSPYARSPRQTVVTNNCQKAKDVEYGGETASIHVCQIAATQEEAILVTFPTFNDDTPKSYNVFLELLNIANQRGIKKLVVDVSYNTGGFVGLAYVAMVGFTGRSPQEFKHFYTTRKTEGVSNLLTIRRPNLVFFRQINPEDGHKYTNKEYYESGETTYDFAPGDTFVKPAFYFNSPNYQNPQELIDFVYIYSNFTPQALPPVPFDDIIILTDAVCQSSCSLFVTALQELKDNGQQRIRVITYGGEPGKPFDVSSIASGILPSIPNITYKPMLVGTDANGEGGQFRQFVRYNPDLVLPIWFDKSNTPTIWSLAIDQFAATENPATDTATATEVAETETATE